MSRLRVLRKLRRQSKLATMPRDSKLLRIRPIRRRRMPMRSRSRRRKLLTRDLLTFVLKTRLLLKPVPRRRRKPRLRRTKPQTRPNKASRTPVPRLKRLLLPPLPRQTRTSPLLMPRTPNLTPRPRPKP